MKKLMIPAMASLLFVGATQMQAQNTNMTLLGQLDYQNLHNSDISDVWGYVDTAGNEYALVGVNDPGGLSIVDVTNPSNLNEVFYTQGSNSIWRDMKTWNKHAYVTTEGGGGLLIVDMSPLPGPITNFTYFEFCLPSDDNSAHNVYIDENGRCYIFGADCGNGGAMMFDLNADPMNPVFEGYFDTWYVHDGMARGDTLYSAHINDGFFTIVDVSDPANPVILGSQNTPSDFAHNVWVSDDGDYLYTTDEVSGAWIGSYDISDPTNISELDREQSNPGSEVIPHNTHFLNEYIITSYYRDGITIHDVSDPANVVEVGNYDTSPLLSGDGFNGSWGAYPWLPSGNILATDIENGLFVLGATYMRGCYLEGTVTEAGSGNPINGVDIEILNTTVIDGTNLTGDYATGYSTAGTYDVAYSKFGYIPDTAYNVSLTNGVVTIQDMMLTALVPFDITGTITEQGSGNPIQGAEVMIYNEENDILMTALTDANGDFTIANVIEENYDYHIGHWGHYNECGNEDFDGNNNDLSTVLPKGYYDDFSTDLGWTISGNATDGIWERGVPQGTFFGGLESNPSADNQNDCYDLAYVTGNGGGGAGSDDVDGGIMRLTSPMFDLTTYSNPVITYDRWFFNAGGQNSPNDTLIIYITNGTDWEVLDMVLPGTAESAGGWNSRVFFPTNMLPFNNTMQIVVHTADYAGSGNLVEAALDIFEIREATTVDEVLATENTLSAMPNPFNEQVTLKWNAVQGIRNVRVMDVSGKLVHTSTVNAMDGQTALTLDVPAGLYFIEIEGIGKPIRVIRN